MQHKPGNGMSNMHNDDADGAIDFEDEDNDNDNGTCFSLYLGYTYIFY